MQMMLKMSNCSGAAKLLTLQCVTIEHMEQGSIMLYYRCITHYLVSNDANVTQIAHAVMLYISQA